MVSGLGIGWDPLLFGQTSNWEFLWNLIIIARKCSHFYGQRESDRRILTRKMYCSIQIHEIKGTLLLWHCLSFKNFKDLRSRFGYSESSSKNRKVLSDKVGHQLYFVSSGEEGMSLTFEKYLSVKIIIS